MGEYIAICMLVHTRSISQPGLITFPIEFISCFVRRPLPLLVASLVVNVLWHPLSAYTASWLCNLSYLAEDQLAVELELPMKSTSSAACTSRGLSHQHFEVLFSAAAAAMRPPATQDAMSRHDGSRMQRTPTCIAWIKDAPTLQG